MFWSRFTDEQVIAIVKAVEADLAAEDACRRLGTNDKAVYRWQSKPGGMEAREARRLRAFPTSRRIGFRVACAACSNTYA